MIIFADYFFEHNMKKILPFVIAIFLGIIAFTTFVKYYKINAPVYAYEMLDQIDVNYYDQALVSTYFKDIQELESFVRRTWYNHRINVLYIDNESEESVKYGTQFNLLKSKLSFIQAKLTDSYQLKKKGFDNLQIKKIHKEGIPQWHFDMDYRLLNLAFGDSGEKVWLLQKKLKSFGYDIPVDGEFKNETEIALKAFQEKNNLYPGGKVNESTLRALIKNK